MLLQAVRPYPRSVKPVEPSGYLACMLSVALPLFLLSVQTQPLPFNLNRPDAVLHLPESLTEVSALTDIDEHTVACVEDEQAVIYLIDLGTGRITGTRAFGMPGDLEGLTRVGLEYYALRSDGLMYRMTLGEREMNVLDTFRVRLPQDNLEGLGYDERRNRVLISPKGVMKGSPAVRDLRAIYAYDAINRKLLPEPVLQFTVTGIIAQARAAGIIIPERVTPKGRTVPSLKLRFSSVAVDPLEDNYYLLSAVDRVLLVMDRNGRVVWLHQLNEQLFPKPEGITFLPSGAMLISNEGKDSRPNLLRFERKP